MDIPEALSGISAYSSIQNLSLVGLKGLRLYLRRSKTAEQSERMKHDLSTFRERFCNVIASISENSSEAMLANVSVFKGINQLYEGKKDDLAKLSKQFTILKSLIDQMLEGRPVSKKDIEPHLPRLVELSQQASRHFRRAESEEFFLGQASMTR